MTTLEKAVLRTIVYSDIFDYPLKGWEIHKWLIGREYSLDQVEKVLTKLGKKGNLDFKDGYFMLAGRKLVKRRVDREGVSRSLLKRARWVSRFLAVIPWIKLVGVSGSLAVNNAKSWDDVDLVIVTGKDRMWITRLGVLGILSALGLRRKRSDKGRQAAGKICVNILLEESSLALHKRNLYIAHEVLQMRVLFQRDETYFKFLTDNEWVSKFLPNWVTSEKFGGLKEINKFTRVNKEPKNNLLERLETFAKRLQLWIMNKPQGFEKIENGALFFHPVDYGTIVTEKYKSGCETIIGD